MPEAKSPHPGPGMAARHPVPVRGPIDAVQAADGVAALARKLAPGLPIDVAIGDRDALLCAVNERLVQAVGARMAEKSRPLDAGTASQLQADVLECVAALEQLHATLAQELGRRQQLELELFDARSALAQARAELAGIPSAQRQARPKAWDDSLAPLHGRNVLSERLQAALALPEPMRRALAVLALDLDGFGPIIDAHGQEAGDEVLRIVAARLERAVRADDLVCHLAGESFALLLADISSHKQLSHLACKLFDVVSAPLKIGALELSLRPGIGIAMCPADGTTAEALLASADAAMGRAVRHQIGYAFFDECGGAALL